MSAALRDEFRNLAPAERVERLTARLRSRPRKLAEAFREPRPLDNEPVPAAERRRKFRCATCARESRVAKPCCHCGGLMIAFGWTRDYRTKPPKPSPVAAPKRRALATIPKGGPTKEVAAEIAAFAVALREFHGAPRSADKNARGEPAPSPPRFWSEEREGVVDGRVLSVRDRYEWSERVEEDDDEMPDRRMSGPSFPWREDR